MAHGNKGFQRKDRVAQQLHEVIATLLLTDVDDPRVQNVQVTDVDVTSDLGHATVYYVLLDKREADPEVQEGLERSMGYLKHELSKRVELRTLPEIHFEYDESVERGRRMEEILSNLDTGDEDE